VGALDWKVGPPAALLGLVICEQPDLHEVVNFIGLPGSLMRTSASQVHHLRERQWQQRQ
jgi:hypothetical protein